MFGQVVQTRRSGQLPARLGHGQSVPGVLGPKRLGLPATTAWKSVRHWAQSSSEFVFNQLEINVINKCHICLKEANMYFYCLNLVKPFQRVPFFSYSPGLKGFLWPFFKDAKVWLTSRWWDSSARMAAKKLRQKLNLQFLGFFWNFARNFEKVEFLDLSFLVL